MVCQERLCESRMREIFMSGSTRGRVSRVIADIAHSPTLLVKAVFFLVAALRAGPLRLFPLRENPLTPRTPRIEPRTSNIELLKPYAPLST
jgi:hypothetical protein